MTLYLVVIEIRSPNIKEIAKKKYILYCSICWKLKPMKTLNKYLRSLLKFRCFYYSLIHIIEKDLFFLGTKISKYKNRIYSRCINRQTFTKNFGYLNLIMKFPKLYLLSVRRGGDGGKGGLLGKIVILARYRVHYL